MLSQSEDIAGQRSDVQLLTDEETNGFCISGGTPEDHRLLLGRHVHGDGDFVHF